MSTPAKPRQRFAMVPVAAISDPRISHATFRTLAAIAAHANKAGVCWPAVPSLAKRLTTDEKKVRERLRRLEELGYLVTEHRAGHTSMYKIIYSGAAVHSETSSTKVETPGRQGPPLQGDPGSSGPGGAGRHDPGTPGRQGGANIPKNNTTEHICGSANKLDPEDEEAFSLFWQAFPSRHPNPKKPAKQKFLAAIKNGTPASTIIRGAKNYALQIEQEQTDQKFVAHATTWLNQDRWEDFQEAPAPPSPAVTTYRRAAI